MGSFLWWLFFSMAAGIGFFWGTILLFGPAKQRPGTKALGLVLLIFSLSLVHFVLVWSENVGNFPHLAGLWMPSNYFYGPLLLLFFLGKEKISWKLYSLHLIPGFLLLLAWIPFGLLPSAEKLEMLNQTLPFDTSLLLDRRLLYLTHENAMISVQLLYCFYFIWKAFSLKNGDSQIRKQLAFLYLIFILAQVSYFILVKWPNFQTEWDYMISFAMTLCIFTIALQSFKRPEYFFFATKRSPIDGKYTTSSLKNDQSPIIAERIKSYVESNKSFLDSELRLPILAEKLDLNSHQVSQAINENFQCSFSEWINKYRIDHACELLLSDTVSAKEAGYQSGFNSLSTFYQVFKKEKGISPAKFSKLKSVN